MIKHLVGIMLTTFVLVACAAETAPDEEVASSANEEDALTSQATSVSLMYEGTCAFLHHCSVPSRSLPVGEVLWGCGGTACDDDALWVAGPSPSYCNRHVRICRGARCVTAVVKDRSNAHGWEASNGVMDALGLAHSVNVSACRGSGGGRVTVQLQ